ncbi:MAG: PfkB family carbohydrate kinase [Candidatus Heimdallarchaeota archaeon]
MKTKVILVGRLAEKLDFVITDSLDGLARNERVVKRVESRDAIRSFDGMIYHVAYGLVSLGVPPTVISQVGKNFDWHFRPHMEGLGIDLRIFADSEKETACSYVLTDENGRSLVVNQQNTYRFFAEHQLKEKISTQELKGYSAGFIATGKAEADIKFVTELTRYNSSLPLIYSPDGNISELTRWKLEPIFKRIALLICSEEELQIIENRLGKSRTEILPQFNTLKYVISITDRTKIVVHSDEAIIKITEGPADEIRRLTGWESAFRAGVIFGVAMKKPIEEAAKVGSALASYAVERKQYSPSPEQIALRAFEIKSIRKPI